MGVFWRAARLYQFISLFRQQRVSIFQFPDDCAELSDLQLKPASFSIICLFKRTNTVNRTVQNIDI